MQAVCHSVAEAYTQGQTDASASPALCQLSTCLYSVLYGPLIASDVLSPSCQPYCNILEAPPYKAHRTHPSGEHTAGPLK